MISRFTLALTCALLGSSPSTQAEQAPGDFSARRVTPPAPDVRKRITVQIAPRAEPAIPPRPTPSVPVTRAIAAPPGASPASQHAWFWEAVSPRLADSGPGRLEPALAALTKAAPRGGGVAAPRLETLRAMAKEHGARVMRATVGTRVSPALALAVMAVESGGRADAVSRAGAQGLMQLMPATAARFGVSDPFDADQNVAGGVAFLNLLVSMFDGDPILVLAGYNAGENSIADNDGVPPYAETRDYVPKVLEAFRTARALCLTPPELISDGCVFVRP
ncbi:lytic transglycosylase domain-containing protein [Citreimonas salinaria]|uniref:Soluble lytic murein transglycosylase n=1 Tax=Citreimonas salinaria TaxID=321339 RepID=A0A1H3MIF1_9RHOB|nr:lytic transglycosylase domain-containing protein [Citreimonas salinaria]SDY76450.1 Soluble lytic murein transglycosylase [Citreimonas salinaria]